MEKSVQKVSVEFDINNKKLSSSDTPTSSKAHKIKGFEDRNEINSWDCSSPSGSEKSSKPLINDWDSSSDIQETMVEVFNMSENQDAENFVSESEKMVLKTELKSPQQPLFVASNLNYFYYPHNNYASKRNPSNTTLKDKEYRHDDLLVEEFEENVKAVSDEDNVSPEKSSVNESPLSSDKMSEKLEPNKSDGEDTTVWMIPVSEEAEDSESKSIIVDEDVTTSNCLSVINEEEAQEDTTEASEEIPELPLPPKSEPELKPKSKPELKPKSKPELKPKSEPESKAELKPKSKPEPQPKSKPELKPKSKAELKPKSEPEPKPKSELAPEPEPQPKSKPEPQTKSELAPKPKPKSELAPEPEPQPKSEPEPQPKSKPEPQPKSEFAPKPKPEAELLRVIEPPPDSNGDKQGSEQEHPESSSIPLIISSTSLGMVKRLQNKDSCSIKTKETETTDSYSETAMKAEMSESWLLFDDDGKYQEISKNEVSIMFNGRSAEAVLQGRAEHLVPTSTLINTNSLKNLLSNFETKDSLRCVSKEDDTGGDDEFKKLIDLERKVENTLFYIRPETDLRASIRIIPVNAEMIHLWKRNKDSGTSSNSFETDLLSLPHDSTETANFRLTRNSSLLSRPFDELLHETENENMPTPVSTVQQSNSLGPEAQPSQNIDYSKLLIETRIIVDNLTKNFRTLQARLDGETNRNISLQGQLSKLKLLVKTQQENRSGNNQGNSDPVESLLTLKASNKVDAGSEDIAEEKEAPIFIEVHDKSTTVEGLEIEKVKEYSTREDNMITVNIYTMEDVGPILPFSDSSIENYTIAQSNLKMIEKKMKRLQQENIALAKQNTQLKKKLKEISLELENYLLSSSCQISGLDEERERELDALRNQVANLQEELNNLKTTARNEEEALTEENFLIREEFAKSLSSLNDWGMMANKVFEKIQISKYKLQEIGITLEADLEPSSTQNPKDFSKFISSHLEQMSKCLHSVKDENFLYEQALKDAQKEPTEISGLDRVISGYSELIEECRKGQITGETKNRVMEDYFAVIMEKASLMEELKILKTENEMLLQSQMEHYEKLKQTMIALKDRKSEITALETSQKLSEDEKTRMTEMLKLCEEEKKHLEVELLEKGKAVEDLVEELKRKDSEIRNCNEKLVSAAGEIKSFEKSCRLKDELINKLKKESEELLSGVRMKDNQIQVLKDEIKNLEMHRSHLEAELNSTKLFVSDSQKEMTDYITHLEALVSSSQESLEKTKQKLKESNQTVNRLKNESEVLEKQHQCDVKLFNNVKDELEISKERLVKTNTKLKELEEEHEKLLKKYEIIAESERQKSESLETLSREFKATADENSDLREKVKIYSQDKEELLSEQKELINKYGLLSKEIQKLQEKYRTVKTECNERTDLIRYMEMMLRENLVEYNNRIACLEQNISQIIEKIVAYKNNIKGKGVDPEVKELRHQLNITCQERKELENVVDNYYSLMKHMENEIQEREKKVDELNVRLSLEQQKAVEFENERSFRGLEDPKLAENLRIEQLENQIVVAENELGECRRELQKCQTNHENEKKKLELTVADLKSEVKRYQLRIEVMMRNLSNCNKTMNGLITDKRNGDDSDVETMKKEIQEKDKTISELNEAINKYKAEVKLKDGDLENFRKKMFYQNDELKNLQNQISRLQDANKSTESQQKERDEMAEKLFQSIKLIMEERSARQTIESLALEKEKNFKNQIDQIKDELVLKIKECETLTGALEEKKKLVTKLQDDLKKMKVEIATLKGQVSNYKKRNEEALHTSSSLTQLKTQHISQQRLDSCLKELKEIRDLNLELRKTEGQYQAKIVRLEDEIRDARLLIKELQGDIKTEKKSKKAFKNMILAAKMEIEKCVMGKQLMSIVAERINRHLDLSEIPSRELLSGFRLSDSSSSLK